MDNEGSDRMVVDGIDKVDPAKRAEIRRRIAIVEEFEKAPGTRAAEAAAERIGIRVSSFYALARAWRETRDPTVIPGGRRWSGRYKEVVTLPPEQEEIASRTVAANPDAMKEHIVDAIIAAGREAGIEMVTRAVLRRHVSRLRKGRSADPDVLETDLVVDHCLVDIPVAASDGGRIRPLATMVLDVHRSAAVGIALTAGPPDVATTARAILDSVEAVRLPDRAPCILVDRPDAEDWRTLATAIEASGLDVVGSVMNPAGFLGDAWPLRSRGNGRTALAIVGRRSLGTTLSARVAHLSGPAPTYATDRRPAGDIRDVETMLRSRMRSLYPPSAETRFHASEEGLALLLSIAS